MARSLKSSFQIVRLAADLRLPHRGDPVAAIVAFCHERINGILEKFGCRTLSDLTQAAAAELDTLFIEIHRDSQLDDVRADYLARRELVFATLDEQLGPHVYAITFKLTHPFEGDRRYLSVIDCRGAKAARAYFSKWHELAHLLTLTSQARLKFYRTHAQPEEKDPEEALMDVIAGEVGFCSRLVHPHATGDVTFEKIDALRERLCPEASQQASLIGLVKSWPTPCVLVQARPALKASEQHSLAQERFGFCDPPSPVLRAVKVTVNGAAERAGIAIHRNMRVPDRSIIGQVFENGTSSLEAREDLAWWVSSDGRGLARRPVTVRARRRGDAAEALISPIDGRG